MESILFLTHTEQDGTLGSLALQVLQTAVRTAGALGGAQLTVGLIGQEVQAAADSIAGCGASRFLAVSGPAFAASRYGSDAAAITALVQSSGASIVMAPAAMRLRRALPGAAFRLEGAVDTQITGVDVRGGELTADRWYYRQRMRGTIAHQRRPWCLLVEAGVDKPWQGAPGSASLQAVKVDLPGGVERTKVLGFEDPAGDARTIRPEAKLLFVAGAGWTKKQGTPGNDVKRAAELILGFLDKSKASLGSSKSLVDQSHEGEAVLPFLTHLNQVGQTGATPRHAKGLATCCHGEEPHVVGWRFITERRAVNTNDNCGWAHGKTDVLYVADAFAVMAEVNKLLAGEG